MACWTLAFAFLVLQLFFALTFNEAYSTGPLPFSCMPVFAVCTSLFRPATPNVLVMMGGSERCSGHMGPLEWKGPHYQVRATMEVAAPFFVRGLCLHQLVLLFAFFH